MDPTIWLLNIGTDAKRRYVLKVPGITNLNALIRKKRAKHLDNLTKKVLPPEVDQKKEGGVTQTRQEELQMIQRRQTLKLQPQVKRRMTIGLMMNSKSEESYQNLPEKARRKPIG